MWGVRARHAVPLLSESGEKNDVAIVLASRCGVALRWHRQECLCYLKAPAGGQRYERRSEKASGGGGDELCAAVLF